VADNFSGWAPPAKPARIVGAGWAPGGQPRVVFGFPITDGKIVAIDILADPEHLGRLDLEILTDCRADRTPYPDQHWEPKLALAEYYGR
jgi:RNA polymerase sigma-70 factor (ECF subfamily)